MRKNLMIHDHISNASNYAFPNPLLQKGLDFLRSPEAASLPVGRLDLDGDRLFALVQEYPTRPKKSCFWEAHRKYVDIQYVVSGVEDIGYAPLASLKILEPYDSAKDMMKLTGNGGVLRLPSGMFAIFFPHDAHKPCMAPNGSVAPVRKIVVKVAVGE
ncbi:MAG: YhcH/YjgK/YiaL family protein [Tepidisphaeraceae bacterium]